MRTFAVLCGVSLVLAPLAGAAANESEAVHLDRKTEVPGATLQPGQYKFQVEDRLKDRAIVRITRADGDQHELVLTVPNNKLAAAGRKGVAYFPGAASQHAIKSWQCSSCAQPLEFVYPKDQAVAITQATGKAAMAVDPSYDKLPANLSPDDMKVVTLWLLSPKEVTPDGKGSGVQPTKYADLNPAETPSTQAVASNSPHKAPDPSMPHTAGTESEYALAGFLLLTASGALLSRRRLQAIWGRRLG